MICVCDICGECVKCTNPNSIPFCTECITLFPFNHIKHDDDFKMNLYSYFHLNNDALTERLKHMKINPLEFNDIDVFSDDNLLFCNNNDDDFPKLNKCKYIFGDEFQNNLQQGNSLSLLHINARSLSKNFDDFHSLLTSMNHNFTAIGVSETWFKSTSNIDMFNIDGYNLIQVNRANKKGGGVGIYVNNKYDYVIRSDLSNNTPEYESLYVELTSKNKKSVVLGCIYRAPNTDLDKFFEKLNNTLEIITKSDKELYLMGDFNINLLNTNSHDKSNEFVDLMFSHNLYPLITKPTRISSTTATLIDNIFCNSIDRTINSGVIIADISDHFPIFCSKKCTNYLCKKDVSFCNRLINAENINKFKKKLLEVDWNQIYDIDYVNHCYDKFLSIFSSLYNECFPLKKNKIKSNVKLKKPWMTNGLLKSINKKHRLYRNFLINPNQTKKNKFTKYKNKLTNLLRVAKADYYSSAFAKLKGDTKGIWKEINNVLGNKKYSKLPSTFYNKNLKLHSMKDIVEEFNNYFLSVGKNLSDKIPDVNRSHDSYLPKSRVNESLFLKPTSPNEIVEIALNIKISKSTGHDDISSRVVKNSIHCFVEPLCYIFNRSIYSGIVPEELKLAKIVPIHKKGDTHDMLNYRPIAILPVFTKLLEKIMYNRLYNFLQNKNILIDNQFGFRKKYSTALAIFSLTDSILKEMEKGNYSIGLFMDLSKAFDTIDHRILLKKLEYYGIRGVALQWFRSYLHQRKQYVMINGVKSSIQCSDCGVPQGSVLGPLLFLIYINDIVNSSDLFRFSLFADDTVATLSGKNLQTLVSSVNREISNISLWFKVNKLSLNLSKTNYIIFRTRKRRVSTNLPEISIDDVIIRKVENVKFLGVTINEHLDWSTHISIISKSVARSVGILSKLKFILPSHILKLIYNSLILPHLSYCNHIWGNSYKSHLKQLLVLQKKSVRIITKSPFHSASAPLFKSLQILPIYDLVTFNTLIFMFSVNLKLLPEKYCNMFVLNSSFHSYSTRQRHYFHLPKVRLTLSINSLSYVGVKYWNQLDQSIRSCSTLSRFKILCRKYLLNNVANS